MSGLTRIIIRKFRPTKLNIQNRNNSLMIRTNIMDGFKSCSISIASAKFFIVPSVLPDDPEGLKSNTELVASESC